VSILLRALRFRHWVKNLLVFVPIVVGHQLDVPLRLGKGALAFIAFCLAASGGYLVNDLVDLEQDRVRASRRHRPFAAGVLDPRIGRRAALVLIPAAFALAWLTLSPAFALAIGAYVAVSLSYSFVFRRFLFLDVIVLTGLYCIRLVGGGVATEIRPSDWLLAFSIFFFLCLALLKRYAELRADNAIGRRYGAEHASLLRIVGPSSGYVATLVLCFYSGSDAARLLYAWPPGLLFGALLLMYWITRIWLLAHRGEVDDDPVIFATRDPITYLVGALLAIVMAVSTAGQ
jgi:4-hydroxybenzoate polyprenyltransferase